MENIFLIEDNDLEFFLPPSFIHKITPLLKFRVFRQSVVRGLVAASGSIDGIVSENSLSALKNKIIKK